MTDAAPEATSGRYAPDDHLAGRTLLIAAAYVVLRRADQVLLLLRTGTGYRDGWWATLAGHVDPGESVHDAAVREAYEEAGVRIEEPDLVPLTAIHRFEPGGPPVEQRLDVFFEVRRWSGEPSVRESDKAAAMTWFDLHALPEAVVPHERRVLQALADGVPLPAVVSLPSDRSPR